jgi:hypothetical protein
MNDAHSRSDQDDFPGHVPGERLAGIALALALTAALLWAFAFMFGGDFGDGRFYRLGWSGCIVGLVATIVGVRSLVAMPKDPPQLTFLTAFMATGIGLFASLPAAIVLMLFQFGPLGVLLVDRTH